jgi:hypothetical protein
MCDQLKKITILMMVYNLITNKLLCIISYTDKQSFSWETCLEDKH